MAGQSLTLPKKGSKLLKTDIGGKKRKSFLSEVKAKTCFAFDFGEYATKIAVAKVSADRVDVKSLIVVENDAQRPKMDSSNIQEWQTNINKALTSNNARPAGQVGLCTVSSGNYISRRFDIPFAEEEDLQGMVAFEMSQNLSLDIDAYFFQYKLLKTYENNGINMCTVWAVAVPKEVCETYFKLLDSLKMRPLVMDVNVNGLERLLNSDAALREQAESSVVATVDLGINSTEVNIFDKGVFLQGSSIDIGDGKLVSAAKSVLGAQVADIHNSNKLVVDPQMVYDILRQTDKSDNAKMFRGCVEEWLSAVNSVVKRYNVKNPNSQISQIFLYGGSLQLSWLRAYIEKYMDVPTKVLQNLDCCRIPEKFSQTSNAVPQFINALSLLLIK